MKKEFTRAEILQGSGCYKIEKGKAESIIVDKQEMNIQEILDLNIPLKDKFWFVRENCELTDKELRMLAIGCATVVLPIYEQKYPNNKAPREAIQAEQDYLNNIISLDELMVKKSAAYAAYDYAYAAADADAAYTAVYKQLLLDFLKDFVK